MLTETGSLTRDFTNLNPDPSVAKGEFLKSLNKEA